MKTPRHSLTWNPFPVHFSLCHPFKKKKNVTISLPGLLSSLTSARSSRLTQVESQPGNSVRSIEIHFTFYARPHYFLLDQITKYQCEQNSLAACLSIPEITTLSLTLQGF